MAHRDALVVYKKSQLQLALEKRNQRIRRLVDADDASVRALRAAHEAHAATLLDVERILVAAKVPHRRVYRGRLRPSMLDGRLIVTVGGDGTLLDASHVIRDQPVLGVNSDTVHSVGFLCAAHRGNFASLLDDILAGRLAPVPVERLGGAIDGTPLPFPVLNDVLVAHANPAATSRYLIEHGDIVEDHKSSGVWISTPAGSTAAMHAAGGTAVALDDGRSQLRVREPFTADGPPLALVAGWLEGGATLSITSKMREGRVWLDGPHHALRLPMGARLLLQRTAPPLHLFTTDEMKRRRDVARARHP